MTGQSRDGESAADPAHAEDRINCARRRTHARQRTADGRQRRIAYSLDLLPATGPAPGESAAPYAGSAPPDAAGADSALPAMDAGC